MLIAVLANRVEAALAALNNQRCVEEYNRATRRGVFTSGREFVVVTTPEHLAGMHISDYRVIGFPEPELVDLARARMVV